MMAKLLPSMASDPDIFYQDLLENLCVPFTNSGSFKKEVTLRDGTKVTHHFSWCVGMMSIGPASTYIRDISGEKPIWIGELHPTLASRMFSSAVKHGLVLPEDMEYLAVDPPLTRYRALPLDEIASWAARYLDASARLNRNLSTTLRQLLGDRPLDAVLAVTMDRNLARRDQILTAMIDLYEQKWPHELIAQWAHEQLGGWFYKDISSSLNWPVGLWPFRQPEFELESL